MRTEAAWMAGVPYWDAKQAIARHVLADAHHAESLLKRLHELKATSAEHKQLAGVEEAESVSDQLMRVRFADGATPAEAIVQAAVAKGWGLYQIGPDQTSLEDVFVQLTYQEQEAA